MPIYASVVLTSSFLLFLVQPILAKQILPWFGGSAAVWTTCLVFFQFVLLFGYAYADWTTRRLTAKSQIALHLLLLLMSLTFLPIVTDPSWKPSGDEDPSLSILGLLTATVGLPFLLLSATGPLVQVWFARTHSTGTPYRLFALSNMASMLGLVAYPAWVEPHMSGVEQSYGFSAAYILFVLLSATGGVLSIRNSGGCPVAAIEPAGHSILIPPSWRERLRWFALAALASFLLSAVTNHVCLNIASVPLLWVLPLGLYLLSFVICFHSDSWYRRDAFTVLAGISVLAMSWFLRTPELSNNLKLSVPLFFAGFFVICMVCHGELARSRPSPIYLTGFYLMVSTGGAIGGLLVGVIAPHVMPAYFELGLGLVAAGALLRFRLRNSYTLARMAGLAVTTFAFGCWMTQIGSYAYQARTLTRNFYGSLRTSDTAKVVDDRTTRKLLHGNILHGEQFLLPDRRMTPTSYYSPTSGVGRAFLSLAPGNRRIGVIGLGTGTLAAYGLPGDSFRFYEINPLIAGLARSEFSFLSDSKARVEIVIGDARLKLEHEPPQQFDLLVVDAFSGDSIPTHLITSEAIAVYLRHTKQRSIIAFHISNRYLELAPVVQMIAQRNGLASARIYDIPGKNTNEAFVSDWVLVSKDPTMLAMSAIQKATTPITAHLEWSMWTDDYNNLFQILR